MASLTVRNIDESIKRKLRMRAASKGRSMEEEVRKVLAESVNGPSASPERQESAGEMFRRIKEAHGGGVDLELPDRSEWKDRPLDLGS